jgi:hypothetical protein
LAPLGVRADGVRRQIQIEQRRDHLKRPHLHQPAPPSGTSVGKAPESFQQTARLFRKPTTRAQTLSQRHASRFDGTHVRSTARRKLPANSQ